jgi:putative ABC transport system permease protein
MIIIESIKLALISIWTNKARSILTMLGIIIGITSVVTLMAMGEGVKKEVKKTINDFGSDYIYIIPGDVKSMTESSSSTSSQSSDLGSNSLHSSMGNPMSFISTDIFNQKDIDEIKKIDGVEYVTPMAMVTGYLKSNDKLVSPIIMGVEPEITKVFTSFDTKTGRFINSDDMNNKNHVIIVSRAFVDALIGKNENGVGKKINLINQDKDNEYEIIGVIEKTDTSSIFSSEMDSMALIPYTTAKNDYFPDKENYFRLGAKAYSGINLKDITKKIEDNLLQRHQKQDFSVLTPEDMMGMLDTIVNLLTTFISAIAAISLVVGGVGIMNIMLVSVTERTREIGLRKAVGATDWEILFQFLIEAVIISLIAGLLSLGIVQIVSYFVEKNINIHPVITSYALVLSISVCVIVGLVFGLAPAIRASRKNPIDALRYE